MSVSTTKLTPVVRSERKKPFTLVGVTEMDGGRPTRFLAASILVGRFLFWG